jgi:hypothetical protein
MMKNMVLKKSGDLWVVRREYNIGDLSWWRTTICDNMPHAIITYIKMALQSKKSR